MVKNVHERLLPVPASAVGPLLDRLGGPDDGLWPSPAWEPMVLDRQVGIGAAGGHGPIRYRVTAHEPGRRVEFTFDPGQGLHGTHTMLAEPAGPARTVLRHVAQGRVSGSMRLLWPLAIRWLHDATVEDAFDRAEVTLGLRAARAPRWSPWVRLLRGLERVRARETAVPRTALLAEALPRVDWADAYAVPLRPGMPTDPQTWADAAFHDPPAAVVALLRLRNALVELVGIERSDTSAFDTVARTADEVLLGTDAEHLSFRVSVLGDTDRVVSSTVVQIHNARGRLYWALVRPVHPIVVRTMLNAAARRLAVTGHQGVGSVRQQYSEEEAETVPTDSN